MDGGFKLQSPHPALQAALPRLAALNPRGSEFKPVFKTREEAEEVMKVLERTEDCTYHLNPIWAVNHSDLTASTIAGWSFTDRLC